MAERDIQTAFNDCIDRLQRGATVAECLALYPQFASQLHPMLQAGRLVERARINPYEVQLAQAQVRQRVLAALESTPRRRSRNLPVSRVLALAAGLILVLGAMLGGASLAAEGSLPGDSLYGLKRLTENMRLTLLDEGLQEVFAQRRIDEIQQLEALQRVAEVDFTGVVEDIDGTDWRIAGLAIVVSDDVPGADGIGVGDRVHVYGQTTATASLSATEIQLLARTDILPTLTPTVFMTPTPTMTGTLTPALTATPAVTEVLPASQVCVPQQLESWVSYTIRAGDTLSALAGNTGATPEQLMQVNCIEDARFIYTGQQIFLPALPSDPARLPSASGEVTGPDFGRGDGDSSSSSSSSSAS